METKLIRMDTNLTDFDSLEYLSETKLGSYLQTIFPNDVFVKDRIVPSSGIRNRPDYFCRHLSLIVEFDGYRHFTDSQTIARDKTKDEVYSAMGINVIRIPYFIQLDKATVSYFFGIDNWTGGSGFPHGFIDRKAKTPADFCSLGLISFHKWEQIMLNENFFDELAVYRSYWFQVNVLHKDPLTVFEYSDYLNIMEMLNVYPT